jgi:ribosomal protein S18 acetylase RimI-like enzyme
LPECPYQLYADAFTQADVADLASFNCGEGPWAEAATEWIHGSDVWESMQQRQTRVWLFRNDKDVVVGFGSLGLTRRKWPPPDGTHVNMQIIPMLGLDYHFHGKPPDREWRYARQIVSHLRYEASASLADHIRAGKSTLPILMLYVHRDNLRAIKLYQGFGFAVEPTARKGDLLLMIQKIDS